MSDELEDVFGEDFAKGIRERTAERRQERNRVTEEQMKKICSMAINDNKFDPSEGDPTFSFTTENGITHQVLLMQVPDPQNGEVWEHLSEPWEGAARLPLEYLGEWYWSTFPEKKDVANLAQGDWIVVVGEIEENEGDDGQVYRNVYPVRGVATLSEAKEYAEQALEEGGFGAPDEEEDDDGMDFADSDEDEEESEEQETEDEEHEEESEEAVEEDDDDEEEESSSGGGLSFTSDDGGSSSSGGGLGAMIEGDEDEEEEEDEEQTAEESAVPYEEIAETVEMLAEKQDDDEEPQVYEIEEGTAQHERFTKIICDRLELDDEEATAEVVIDVIQQHRDDGEEEEEDDDMSSIF